MDYNLIGRNIKKERMKQKMTQEQLSEKIGISTNFLACIEIGVRHGSFETYAKIANTLCIALDTLINDVSDKYKGNPLKEKLNYYFDSVSPQEQHLIVKLAQDISDIYKI